MQRKRRRKKTGKPFPSFRCKQYLKNRYEMKERNSKRLQRFEHCCKNTTKGKMRFLYRRKNLDREVKINQFRISVKFYWDCPGGYFRFKQNLKSIKVKSEILFGPLFTHAIPMPRNPICIPPYCIAGMHIDHSYMAYYRFV